MTKRVENKVDKYLKNTTTRMYSKHNLMKSEILYKEKYLKKECSRIWEFTNPQGTKYLFGMFEDVIVSLGYFNNYVHKFIPVN